MQTFKTKFEFGYFDAHYYDETVETVERDFYKLLKGVSGEYKKPLISDIQLENGSNYCGYQTNHDEENTTLFEFTHNH